MPKYFYWEKTIIGKWTPVIADETYLTKGPDRAAPVTAFTPVKLEEDLTLKEAMIRYPLPVTFRKPPKKPPEEPEMVPALPEPDPQDDPSGSFLSIPMTNL